MIKIGCEVLEIECEEQDRRMGEKEEVASGHRFRQQVEGGEEK